VRKNETSLKFTILFIQRCNLHEGTYVSRVIKYLFVVHEFGLELHSIQHFEKVM